MAYQDALAGRASVAHQIYHITICTYQRQPFFACWRTGRVLVHILKDLQQQQVANSLAWVIMPDHLHWLMQLGDSHPLADALQLCKGRSAKAINQHLSRQGPLWQKGVNDRAIRKEEDLVQVARYIVANPLRARLVNKLGDYPLWDAVWL